MAKKLKLKSVSEMKDTIKKNKKEKKKKQKRKGRIGSTLGIIFITVGIAVASLVIAFSLYIVFTSPEFTTQKLYKKDGTVIYWADGSVLTRFGAEDIVIKNYEDFPQVLVDALVATEDARFFQHSGFDAARFIKASAGQALGQSGAGGASTLSMQLAKNNFNGTEDSGIAGIIRKFKDIYMAVFKIEKSYTKEQIIEMYLNSYPFAGGDGTNTSGTVGIERASQLFFGKTVSDLSLPEAATLVGMLNASTLYNPYYHPEASNNRKNTVLSLMNRHGYITEEEMKIAQGIHVKSLLKPVEQKETSANPYQALIDYVVDEIEDKESIDLWYGGYEVYTTFNKDIQDILNAAEQGQAYTFTDEKLNLGIAVTSVNNGSIVAMGPGRNYTPQAYNWAVQRHQPGSTAKPLVDYGPLIEYKNANTMQMFMDFRYPYNQGTYINNWDNGFRGVMTMKDALSQSRNVTALQAFQQNKNEDVKTFLTNLGFKDINFNNNTEKVFESSSIGGAIQLSPLENSAAYAAFARGGYYIEPYSYAKIINKQTEETIEHKYEKTRAMSEATAYMITDILLQATRENVGGPISANLKGSIASKSGTSNVDTATANAKNISVYATPDHWVNTYNSEYAISMWLGHDYDDLGPGHYLTTPTGSGPRGTISAFLANRILTKNEAFKQPSSVKAVTIESYTLPTKRASENTPSNMKRTSLFKEGTEPADTSSRYANLENASGIKTSVSGNTITISWNSAPTPDAYNLEAVKKEFSSYFSDFKRQYSYSYSFFEKEYMRHYEQILNSNLGTLGYQVYLKDNKGNLTSLGWTQNTSYTYKAPSGGNYSFVVKTSYSIFKSNQASGIEASAKIESSSEPETDLIVKSIGTCIKKGTTFQPKDYISVTYKGSNVLNDAVITSNSLDTSKEGNQSVNISVTYEGIQKQITLKLKVASSCD